MICANIQRLINYAVKCNLITKDDELKVSIAEYLKNACFRFREEAGDYQAKYDKYNAIVNAAE